MTERTAPPVYIEDTPEVVCDANGVVVTGAVGDTVYSLRLSRHRALNVAALVVAAVSKFEREEAHADKIAPIRERGEDGH